MDYPLEYWKERALGLAKAAMLYDAAIYAEAGSTAAQQVWADEGYANPFIAAGADLDALYFDWLSKARAIVEAAQEQPE